MFATDDTIVAVATPPGRGGLGVIRISGARALEIAAGMLECRVLEPRRATFTRVLGPGTSASAVDEIVATAFPSPESPSRRPRSICDS